MYSEKNITIIQYQNRALSSLEYLHQFFTVTIDPLIPISSHLYILTTTPLMDAPLQKCKIIRTNDLETPIVILSEKYDEIEAVTYFEMGADDYVSLPLKNREFIARIKALMRRAYLIKKEPDNVIKIGDISIYPDSYAIYKAGVQKVFTAAEIRTLIFFIKNENNIISRKEIWKHIDSKVKESTGLRVIDVYISRLRNVLGLKSSDSSVPYHIRTVIGSGYVFEEEIKQQST